MIHHALGCLPPPDDRHRQKYPLLVGAAPHPAGPMVIGVQMFDSFYKPTRDRVGFHWIGANPSDLGAPGGCHAMCLLPHLWFDSLASWRFYDQGREGACTGFAASRMMTLYNRQRYDGFSLYRRTRQVDEFPGEAYEGTTIRATLSVLKTEGAWPVSNDNLISGPDPVHGIKEYRWAQNLGDVRRWLGIPSHIGYVQVLNSWGRLYPHVVRLPFATLERLWADPNTYLEFAAVTDR